MVMHGANTLNHTLIFACNDHMTPLPKFIGTVLLFINHPQLHVTPLVEISIITCSSVGSIGVHNVRGSGIESHQGHYACIFFGYKI